MIEKLRCERCKKVKFRDSFYYRGGTQAWCKTCAKVKEPPKWKVLTDQEAMDKLGNIMVQINKKEVKGVPMSINVNLTHVIHHLMSKL